MRKNGGQPPLTYQTFCRIIGKPPPPLDTPASIPTPPEDLNGVVVVSVPTIEELGYVNLNEVCDCFMNQPSYRVER